MGLVCAYIIECICVNKSLLIFLLYYIDLRYTTTPTHNPDKKSLHFFYIIGTFQSLNSIVYINTNKRSKKMAQLNKVGKHRTKVGKEGRETFVKYWHTKVVSFTEDTISLNNGGFLTNTTKARMNQASNEFGLGYRGYQKNYEWFVEHNGKTHEFTENMIFLNRN